MSYNVKDMRLTMLGIVPALHDETGFLKPQDIVALSALMTFKGKSVKDLYNEAKDKGQDLGKKVKTIIRKSSLRGHASIATTPVVCFTYEASKFIDSLMTGMVFSSSLMASGRRTDTTAEDILYPDEIDKNREAKELYKETSIGNINILNELLAEGINKDEASKILHYGIYGTGIIMYPIESIIAFKKEVEVQGEWMPKEARMMIDRIEKELKKMGIDLIYASRELAGRNTLPYPNIFKDPKFSNITRELIKKRDLPKELTKIIETHITATEGLEKGAKNILKIEKEIASNRALIKKHWRELLVVRHNFCRDYNTALQVKALSSISWRVWGDKKRHRTVPMTPDSIYFAIERCRPVFRRFHKKIIDGKLSKSDLANINRYFSIPPVIAEKKELLYKYLLQAMAAFDAYFELINKYKITPAEAIYVMPRGVRIDILQVYDLYNLIAGYYPLRTCSTVEAQLRPMALYEMGMIKTVLAKKGYPNLAKLMVTKCQIPLFCLEEKNCPMIKLSIKDYDEVFHEELKTKLDEEFEARLKEL